jgi:hypothetical protein
MPIFVSFINIPLRFKERVLMKRSVLSLFLVLAVFLALGAQTPAKPQPKAPAAAAAASEQTQAPKPEDLLKNLVTVEKVVPAPDRMKVGLESITPKDSLALLSYLSSDLMEGRETATRGYDLAADYVASLFSLWKIRPAGDTPSPRGMSFMRGPGAAPEAEPERSYLQRLALRETQDASATISLETRLGSLTRTRSYQVGQDFMGRFSTAESLTAPVVFAGYGLTEKGVGWDDFKNLNVKDKFVLILSEAPGKDDPRSPFQRDKELKEKYFPARPASPFARMGRGFNKTREIAKLGPAAILVVQNSEGDAEMFKTMGTPRPVSDDRPIITEGRRSLSLPGGARMPWEGSPTITITREMADAILEPTGQKIDDLKKKIETTLKPASQDVPGARLTLTTTAQTRLVTSSNVIGYIEGSDPALKDEVVMVGAHLDHLGKRGDYVFNGADDNGSGSVGVVNIARAFALNPERPKRTVVFCLWTGEEEGLLGSRYYVQNPEFPLAKTVAYFNLDMISRPYDEQTISRMSRWFGLQPGDEIFKKIKPADFLPVSFTAGSGLAEVLRTADQSVGLQVLLREQGPSPDRGSGGSDHSSFGMAEVPWLFAITAMTEDYHQTSDSVEKVSGESIARVSRLTYLTVFNLADK